MRVLPTILLVVSSAFAYQVTYPGGSQGWNSTGPNYLEWERVDTDPLNFTAVLTNVNSTNNLILISYVDGTVGNVLCPTPLGGWPVGSGYRVNLVQDQIHLNSLLAQSTEFTITAVASSQSTTSAASTPTVTSTTNPSISSSDTSTSPTGVSAAPRCADTRLGWLTAIGALTALITAPF